MNGTLGRMDGSSRAWSVASWCTAVLIIGGLSACTAFVGFEGSPEESEQACSNGLDDDADGLFDCDDDDCGPFCPEECFNEIDDDRNGLIDGEQLSCWTQDVPRVGYQLDDGSVSRCADAQGSSFLLADHEAWTLDEAEGSAARDPDSGVVLLDGEGACQGVGVLSRSCPSLTLNSPITGTGCWEARLDVIVKEGAELALGFSPALEPSPLLLQEALILAVRRVNSSLIRVGWGHQSPEDSATVEAMNGAVISLVIGTKGDDNCERLDSSRAKVSVRVSDTGLTTSLDAPETPSPLSARVPLFLSARATLGAVDILRLDAVRDGAQTCGFPVPQLPRGSEGASEVIAAATDGTRICVLFREFERPRFVPTYDARIHQGSPPMVDSGVEQAFSLSVAARGLESFRDFEPDGPHALLPQGDIPLRVLSGAMAGSETGFKAWLLVESLDSRTTELIRAESLDCAQWSRTTTRIVAPGSERPLHPLFAAEEPSGILLLAEPAQAYEGIEDPRCDTDVGGDFVGPEDRWPFVKPRRSECMPYPRARLWQRREGEEAKWIATLPSLNDWTVDCGCIEGPPNWRDEVGPIRIRQILLQRDERVLVGEGGPGVLLIRDETPEDKDLVTIQDFDAELSPEALLAPNTTDSTFDAAAISAPHLLPLDRRSGLLFYTGFRSALPSPEGETLVGGDIGVVPVHFR